LKWLNFSIDGGFHKKTLINESAKLLKMMNVDFKQGTNSLLDLLERYRMLDKTV
jgi:hypothetical protein